MPNTFAYIALLGWPLIAFWLFATKNFEKAIIWSVVVSYLFLPSSFAIDLPGLPPLDRISVPNLTLLVLVISMGQKRFRLLPQNAIGKTLIILLVISAFFTSLSNQDPIWIGDRFLPGMSLYDGLSRLTRTIITIIPFLVGWQYLYTLKMQREIIKVIFLAGMAYSLLMLFEVRMSPQLHTLVYGYFPHNFLQQIRYGGFRPVVFLNHGLTLALFSFTIVVASAALWRDNKLNEINNYKSSILYFISTVYLVFILILCKSLSSIIYGIIALPLIIYTKPRLQIRVAVILAIISFSYPIMRGTQLIPVDTIVEFFKSIDPDRGHSLEFRFKNEDLLLDHASGRPLFGFGGHGRNRVFDEMTGEDASVTDGRWILVIGTQGWLGYFSFFGILILPILSIWRRMRNEGTASLTTITGALCLVQGIYLLNSLPNAGIPTWAWLIAGALLGYSQARDKVQPTYIGSVERSDSLR